MINQKTRICLVKFYKKFKTIERIITMENKLKKVGCKIKELRSQRGISQIELAKKIGLSQTNLSNIERGRTTTTLQNLFKIQEVLQCRMADFFDEEDASEETASVDAAESSSVSIDDAIKVLQLIKELSLKNKM